MSDPTTPFPGPSEHEGHDLRYELGGSWNYKIVGVNAEGDVLYENDPAEFDASDTWIVCNTCGRQVNGDDIGACDDWQAEPVAPEATA